MPDRVITLTCDFGDKFAVAQMELVMHGISPITKFIVLSNEIKEYSIVEGAFVILKGYKFAPCGSVHIGIVDPGVGSDRRGVVIKTKNAWFVGPDNGLLYPAATDDGIERIYEINESALGNITNTFHERDVFAKVAAKIAAGEDASQFLLPTQKPLITLNFTHNQIVHIDPYGNIKIHTKRNDYKNRKNLKIKMGQTLSKIPVVKTFADVPVGSFLAYTGSHETLEIAINQNNAAKVIKAKVGSILTIAN